MITKNTSQPSLDARADLLRGLPVVDVALLPDIPPQFHPLTAAEESELLKVAKGNEFEMQEAMVQLAERGAEVEYDLGKDAPDPARATALAERLKANNAVRTKLAALLAYADDINAVALHDAVLLFNEVSPLLSNLKKDVPLQDRYSKVLEYAETAGLAPNTGHWFDAKIKQGLPAKAKKLG